MTDDGCDHHSSLLRPDGKESWPLLACSVVTTSRGRSSQDESLALSTKLVSHGRCRRNFMYFAKLLVTWCALQTVFRLHRLHHRHAVRSRDVLTNSKTTRNTKRLRTILYMWSGCEAATVGGRSSPVIKQIRAPAPPGL